MTRPPSTDRAITQDLIARLRRHYINPGRPRAGGVFLTEVGHNGSSGAASRADALYIGFTSTSGRQLVGHEIKASRSDWLNELTNPSKADAWADQCHEWWLVTAPGVVKDGELPAGWGHMLPGRSQTRMQIVVPAVRRDLTPSWDAVRSVIARMDTLAHAERVAIHAEAQRKARASYDADLARAIETHKARTPDALELSARLERIEDALGRPIDTEVIAAGHWPYGAYSLAELREIGLLLSTRRDLAAAHAALVNTYNGSLVRRVREAAEELEHALAGLDATARTG